LVDDDPEKRRTKLCGVSVFGPIDQLPVLAHRLAAREVLIAIPSATAVQMLRITDFCVGTGLPFRTMPSLADVIAGKMRLADVREDRLDELLHLEPQDLETDNDHPNVGRAGVVVVLSGRPTRTESAQHI